MKPLRILAVLGGLAIGGALVGGLAGVLIAAIVGSVMAPRDLLANAPFVFSISSVVGGTCGLILAPLASFAFMRHVPLWRLFAEALVGTTLGGALGFFVDARSLYLVIALAGCGFLLAGARLAWVYRRGRLAAEVVPIE